MMRGGMAGRGGEGGRTIRRGSVERAGAGAATDEDGDSSLSRRALLRMGLAALVSGSATSCIPEPTAPDTPRRQPSRLLARPGEPAGSPPAGESWLGVSGLRDAILYVPQAYDRTAPAPLLVTLHGRDGDARDWQGWYDEAEDRGFVMLAVESRTVTWDLLGGAFGADVTYIDQALTLTFDLCAIDPERVALCGFSDGASYALSLGPPNGDLFTHLVAFSPGFSDPPGRVGWPRIWMSHGTSDPIFDEEYTFRKILPDLRDAGFEVTYVPFDGGHEVPPLIATRALDWFSPVPAASP